MIAIALDGETVDAVCWRVLGRTESVTEQTFNLNPGLAALGPCLPGGTQVTLPDVDQAAPAQRPTLQLWN